MNNEKDGPEAFGPRARNMIATIPLRWQPHDSGDIPRKFEPCKLLTTQVSTCALDQQEEMATVCGVLFQHGIVSCFFLVKALRIIPTCRSKLLVCCAVREVFLAETSQHHTAIVQAGPSSRWESQLGITGAE